MPRGVRKNITIPGLLAPTVKQRCGEFGDGGFAPYAVELVCYDRRALQGRLAERWRIAPNEVTGPVIMQRLNGDGESIRLLFRAADEASYSRRSFTSAELRQWRDTFTKQLHRIKTL